MNENEEYVKFIVIKLQYAEEALSDQQIENFKDIINTVQKYREEMGKNTNPTYYVINTDEPYADQVKEIIDKGEGK